MTVIYLDAFLVLNLGVNYLLLAAAGRLDGGGFRRVRCLGAAGLGTAYAALSLLPGLGILEHPVGKAGAAVLMLLAAFGRSDRLLRVGALFLLLSCAFGGLLFLLALRGGGTGGLSIRGILVSAALSYGLLSLILGAQFTHSGPRSSLRELTLTQGGRSVTLLALEDTGNTLRDPLTGRPVVVVQGEKLQPILPALGRLDRERLARPVELLEEVRAAAPELPVQLLPYRAVGVDCGLLLALRLEEVRWGERVQRNCLTALSPTPLSDGGNCCALISAPGA